MKKNLFLFAGLCLSIILALSLVSCEDSEVEATFDQIILDEDNSDVVFTLDSDDAKTLVFSSSANWTLSVEDGDWVSVSPTSGGPGSSELTITLLENNFEDVQEATVKISAGNAWRSFKVIYTPYEEPWPGPDPIPVEGVELLEHEVELSLNQRYRIEYTLSPARAKAEEILWSSSDTSILTITETGVITAVEIGTATITIKVDGKFTDTCDIEVIPNFISDGDGKTYTFKTLSAMPHSGVTKEGTDYVVTRNFTISVDDEISIENNDVVKIMDGVEIRIMGSANFAVSGTATFEPYDGNAKPSPIYFTGDDQAGGTFRNITLIDVPVRYFGTDPLTFDKCEFKDITTDFAAINLGGDGQVTVTGCRFIENCYPAISSGSNMTTPLLFKDNYLYRNSKTARNRPQINVSVAGNGAIEIIGNEIYGPAEITTNGGIAVSNLLGIQGTNKVLIEGNMVRDCRYGLTTSGMMDARMIDNKLYNNNFESNPMSGGSGISITDNNGIQTLYLSGNHIEGHHWGITLIGSLGNGKGPTVNMGKTDDPEADDYNPGGNVFINNGNNGVLYDLYNNSPIDVWAQGNRWNVDVQDQTSIEGVIFHKVDQSNLGEVFFMPPASDE